MPEPRTPEAGLPPGPPPPPRGNPRFAWFDGILEAPKGDLAAMRAAIGRVSATGFARLDLEVEGGRVSILVDDHPVGPALMTDANREALVGGLQAIVAALPPGARIESTLRCTEVFDGEVRETLFDASGGELRSVSCVRPATPDDLARAPVLELPLPSLRLGRKRTALLAVLFLVAFGVVAWQGGWLDAVFGASAGGLAVETDPFGKLLDATIETSWGAYVVKVRRGPEYPATNEQQDRLIAAAADPAHRAAVSAAVEGGVIYARIEDADGKVLESKRMELRPLVGSADAVVEARFQGRIAAARLRLALDAGPPPK